MQTRAQVSQMQSQTQTLISQNRNKKNSFIIMYLIFVLIYQILAIGLSFGINNKDILNKSYKIDIFAGLMAFTNILNIAYCSVELAKIYNIRKNNIQHTNINLDNVKFVSCVNGLYLIIQLVLCLVNTLTNDESERNDNMMSYTIVLLWNSILMTRMCNMLQNAKSIDVEEYMIAENNDANLSNV